MSQLLFCMLYGMACSCAFSALNNYTFALANLEVKKKKVRWCNHNLVCYSCDEAALSKSIAVALFKESSIVFFIMQIFNFNDEIQLKCMSSAGNTTLP